MSTEIDRPAGTSVDEKMAWGSDAVAATLRALGLPYVALVPGSSFRGLQDSLVNYLGNLAPQMVVCLHEEHAVAIADGYARVTGRPMAVALHANVGLMHAAMAVYNAWCDRVPMLILGANGPVDADKRRPWIDWVHTSRDQASIVRSYIKWDDQPASVPSAVEATLRAHQISCTSPHGPTYVCLDVMTQEQNIGAEIAIPPVVRYAPPGPPAVPASTIGKVVEALRKARRPLLLCGRVSRSQEAWDQRVTFAEKIGAVVLTSIVPSAAFPSEHPQHVLAVCGDIRTEAEKMIINQADLIISLDWLDLAGFLRSATGRSQTQLPAESMIVHVSMDSVLANGCNMDHQALPAVDIPVFAAADTFVAQMLDALDAGSITEWDFTEYQSGRPVPAARAVAGADCVSIGDLAAGLNAFAETRDVTLVRVPLSWPPEAMRIVDPLSFLGRDGAAAVGVGPGHAVGAALALQGSKRLCVAVLGDGDTAMGINALWTAARMRLPMLIVVANNQSYFNDELHQERVAMARGRPTENRWIGQSLTDPEIDLKAMARAQGFKVRETVRTKAELLQEFEWAEICMAAGSPCLINVQVEKKYSRQ